METFLTFIGVESIMDNNPELSTCTDRSDKGGSLRCPSYVDSAFARAESTWRADLSVRIRSPDFCITEIFAAGLGLVCRC